MPAATSEFTPPSIFGKVILLVSVVIVLGYALQNCLTVAGRL
jgi:hypothetical protein